MSGWLAAAAFLAVAGLAAWAGVLIARRVLPPRPRATVRSTSEQVTFGLVFLMEALVFFAAGLLSNAHARPGQLWPWLAFVFLLASGGLVLCVAGVRKTVRWDRAGLVQTGVLHGPRFIGWTEIDALEPRGTSLGLRLGRRRLVLCDFGAEGIEGLLKAAERQGVPGVAEVRPHLRR